MNKEETLYKIGDQVEIVNYGHLLISTEPIKEYKLYKKLKYYYYDTSPELVGKKGIIIESHKTQGEDTYSLKGISKVAWYSNNQLKLIHRPKYE